MRLAPLPSTCVYLNNNARYDRPKISHELQVNVPRTMGILRDVEKALLHHFENALLLPPSPSNAMLTLKRNCLQQTCLTFWLWGGTGQVESYSRATICLSCKLHKGKFVPRFLSMIVEWIINF